MNEQMARMCSVPGRMTALAAALVLGACAAEKPVIEVWKTASCGCCIEWVRHLEASGYDVRARNVEEPAVYRKKLGMPDALGSCHTAAVAGYALEGHVPVREIRRLLAERPNGVGLAVPAMPVGSPGMDGPEYGDRRDPYDVLLVARGGAAQIFASYR